MDLNELPVSKKDELDELKSKLNALIRQAAVTQFEGEDILQLIGEGEKVEWIVGQVQANSPSSDTAQWTDLLTAIQHLIAPGEVSASDSPSEEQPSSPEALDTAEFDLSQIGDMLPPGMDMPPNLDANELKSLVESDQGKMMLDFILFCREKGIEVGEGFLNDPRIGEWQREWVSTPRGSFGGKTPGEMMEGNPGLMPQQVETYRRAEPRIGRNDPCPCGSGKKYKKCCGRG